MCEIYTLLVQGNGKTTFAPREDAALAAAIRDGLLPDGHQFVNRLGDAGLLQCSVFRREAGAGGCFVVQDSEGQLFAVVAESNLAYGLGLGRFGRLVAYARYGADIFENADVDDDDL